MYVNSFLYLCPYIKHNGMSRIKKKILVWHQGNYVNIKFICNHNLSLYCKTQKSVFKVLDNIQWSFDFMRGKFCVVSRYYWTHFYATKLVELWFKRKDFMIVLYIHIDGCIYPVARWEFFNNFSAGKYLSPCNCTESLTHCFMYFSKNWRLYRWAVLYSEKYFNTGGPDLICELRFKFTE